MWKLRNENVIEAVKNVIWILLLLKHHCISGCRVKDLLAEQVSDVRKKSYCWHHNKKYPSLAILHYMPILATDLWLKNCCNPRHISEEYIRVIENQAPNVDKCHNPVPVNTFDKQFESHNVDEQSESQTRREPV